ncbi:hypothetical protein C8Q74DRAFT_258563 [Fomes fomentarius]|nr:hypothetical protein C8Q74DRAFT_258563 [Fomes fomentarius]
MHIQVGSFRQRYGRLILSFMLSRPFCSLSSAVASPARPIASQCLVRFSLHQSKL